MKNFRQTLGIAILALGLLGGSIQGSSASELTDAENRLDQLRQSHESDTQLVNVTLRGYELDAFNCVQRYASDTTPESIALKNDCQTALDRTQADIFTVTRRAAATQNEMNSVRALIEKLKSAPPAPSPSPSMASSTEPTPSAAPNSTEVLNSAKGNQPITPAKSYEIEPTPLENQKPLTEKFPTPQPSKSSVVAGGTKVKPSAKKLTRTIKCVKGKTARTISGVSPKCPAGFKRSS